ncbi:MAG TPA: hypothetical protein PK156_48020 [Polyangium sp.]|nr:hypothetical protein [Polyangium sp.]
MNFMRLFCSLLVAGSFVASVSSAEQPPPAVATGSIQNSGATTATQPPASPAATAPAKPAKRAARKAKKRQAVKGPVANFPSFRVLPDGSSRIHVEVSAKVSVAERKAEGRLAYRLKGASVPVRTNLLPLETSFFKTPVARATLVEVDDEDVELVIELRQPSTATYKVVDTDAGMILQVDFPAPTTQAAPPPPAK